jgi:hypothetical protein
MTDKEYGGMDVSYAQEGQATATGECATEEAARFRLIADAPKTRLQLEADQDRARVKMSDAPTWPAVSRTSRLGAYRGANLPTGPQRFSFFQPFGSQIKPMLGRHDSGHRCFCHCVLPLIIAQRPGYSLTESLMQTYSLLETHEH